MNNVEGNSKKAGNWFESGRNRSSFSNASLRSYSVDTQLGGSEFYHEDDGSFNEIPRRWGKM
jgi:hypothetical protein